VNRDQIYQQILSTNDLPIFLLPQWMDIVAPDWQIVVSQDKQGQLNGLLPFQRKMKWGMKACVTPWLTPYSGPWTNLEENHRNAKSIGQHQAITNTLVSKLPKSQIYQFKLRPTLFPAHAWYWAGYNLGTKYTYQLKLDSQENIFSNFKNTIRTALRKIENDINVLAIDDPEEWQNFVLRNGTPHYAALTKGMAYKLFHLKESICLKAISNNSIIGVSYFVKTMKTIYYLIGIRNDDEQNLATTAMLWHIIQEFAGQAFTLDFEGSMLPSVEPYFRRFGGDPVSYLQVTKQHKWVSLLR